MNQMTKEKMKEFVAQFDWIPNTAFADVCPHEYIIKTKIDSSFHETFEEVVEFIRLEGFDAAYETRVLTYYILDNYYYWTMNASVSETTILNRASLDDFELIDGSWELKD